MRKLMSPIPFPQPEHIKSRILMESVRLFALNGYDAVSIREIASAAGVHANTIHHHYPSKLSVMEAVMEVSDSELRIFYDMLDRISYEAKDFRQLLNNLFQECKTIVNPFTFYTIYCAMIHQFSLECCRHSYYDVYFVEGHKVMRRQMEIAIERELVEPFDVPQVASIITNCFVTMIGFNVGRLNGFYEEFGSVEWFDRTIEHILRITGAIGK